MIFLTLAVTVRARGAALRSAGTPCTTAAPEKDDLSRAEGANVDVDMDVDIAVAAIAAAVLQMYREEKKQIEASDLSKKSGVSAF